MYKISQKIIIFIIINASILFSQSSWVQTSLNQVINQLKADDSGNIYAVGGDVYRSSDEGQNWIPIFIKPQNSYGAISIGIFSDSALFIGTSYDGLYKSTDNGNTWLKINTAMGNVTKFAINNSGDIFAASTNGIYKSTDNGDNWQQVSSFLSSNIVFDKNNGKLYATFLISDYSTTVYESADKGETWSPANNGLVSGSASITLAISPQGYIFAGTMYNGVFRSTDGGNSWRPINFGLASNHEWIRDFAFKSQNQIFAVGYGNVYFSKDNGDTWGVVNKGLQPDWDITRILSTGNLILINWIGDFVNGSYHGGIIKRSNFSTLSIPPILVYPINNATNVGNSTILKWNSGIVPSTYHLQIAYDSSFSIMAVDSIDLVDTSFQTTKLQNGEIYYWRVSEINNEGESGWSYNWNFTTSYPPIAPPNLLSPLNGATNILIEPTLVWKSVPSNAYDVQMAQDENFSSIIYQDSTVTDTSINIAGLNSDTKYYWHVKTIRKDSTSNWSKSWHFTTGNVNIHPRISYFPLSAGDKWFFSQGYSSTISTKLEVQKDTLLDDGYLYSKLNYYIVNTDSSFSLIEGNSFYLRYDADRIIEYPNTLVLDFDMNIGDTIYTILNSYPAVLSDMKIEDVFGRYLSTYYLFFTTYDYYTFTDSIGFNSSGQTFRNYPTTLEGCEIDGKIYGNVVTGIANQSKNLITDFRLAQNYPNPFNPTTMIEYSVPRTSFITLKVYDILGREVSTLVNEEKQVGTYKVEFNGNNLSSGIYFYRIQAR